MDEVENLTHLIQFLENKVGFCNTLHDTLVGGMLGFSLKGDEADQVFLVVPDATGGVSQFVDQVEFGASFNGQTFGRVPNGIGRLASTAMAVDPLERAKTVWQIRGTNGGNDANISPHATHWVTMV